MRAVTKIHRTTFIDFDIYQEITPLHMFFPMKLTYLQGKKNVMLISQKQI